MKVFRHFSEIATLEGAFKKDGRRLLPNDLGLIQNASIVFDEEKILWIGPDTELPTQFQSMASENFSGHVLTPEIVDSHTHVVFGGDRAFEYAMRLNGDSYESIAKAGGGILKTMTETRKLSREELFELACERVERIYSYGIGTIEIKSGYALNYEKEKELSLVIDDLKKHFAPRVQIFNTFMAAHAVPKEFSSSQDYMNQVVIPLMKELAPKGIIDAVDLFHEVNYFSENDVRLLAHEAKKFSIPLKIHADEFNDNKGAMMACELNALSADHLLKTSEDGIATLVNSKTVATLLPGTGLFLGKEKANARRMLDAGVKVAIGSDYNPGSCHCDNLLMLASIAAPFYKMNMCELWASITLNSAAALGFNHQGAIVPGMKPRFSIFSVSQLAQVTYGWGRNFASKPNRLDEVALN